MKVLLEPKTSNNYLVTVAIGEDYLNDFKKFIYKTWEEYAIINDIGIILFDSELIDKKEDKWKKPNWQKLLVADSVKGKIDENSILCYLDTDILINPSAPNIFKYHKNDYITVVSQVKNIPYPEIEVKKNISYNRNKYYSEEYPLDSAIFMTPMDIYKFHKKKPHDDYFCTGLFMFQLSKFRSYLKKVFNKYNQFNETITGGDEFHINYEFNKLGKLNWIDYRFQAIWTYEMGWFYPFLYKNKNKITQCVIDSVRSSLQRNFFLHFAGSWYESFLYKSDKIINKEFLIDLKKINDYKKIKSKGDPVGIIKPR